jgi:hypothetical protein
MLSDQKPVAIKSNGSTSTPLPPASVQNTPRSAVARGVFALGIEPRQQDVSSAGWRFANGDGVIGERLGDQLAIDARCKIRDFSR